MRAGAADLGVLVCAIVLACGLACSNGTNGQTDDGSQPDLGSTYDRTSALQIVERSELRACVQVQGGVADAEEAAAAIERALLEASRETRWPDGFGVPIVDSGCPLGPVALETSEPFPRRKHCVSDASPYLVFAFVAEPSQLTERFPASLVSDSDGVRKAGQEVLRGPEGGCVDQVSEAWYLTPDDLGDDELLRRFIYGPLGIFTIADFQG